jgi:hypothetical protein
LGPGFSAHTYIVIEVNKFSFSGMTSESIKRKYMRIEQKNKKNKTTIHNG